jgi:polyisoprenoid-binding protein YceI
MIMKKTLLSITTMFAAALGTLALVGCGNPAENVTPAAVGEAATVSDTGNSSGGSTAYAVSADSKIGFVGSKVTGSHEGGFNTFKGTLSVADGKLVAAGSSVEIDMNSLWSDADMLTGHLKSSDFFDVETFATTTFTFTGIGAGADGTFNVTGNLELRGVTKSISFPATVVVADGQISLNAEFFLKRSDFGIVYPGKKDDLIREEVVIKLDVLAKA